MTAVSSYPAPSAVAKGGAPTVPLVGAGTTRRLAKYIVETEPRQLPIEARREAVRSLVNYVGCAVGGSHHETVEKSISALQDYFGPSQATLLGRRNRTDCLHAALLNGISSHVLDFDDTQLSTIIHPAGPVASAILPLAERQTIHGQDFLAAFILGVEAGCRIGKAIYPSHYDAGWHITGTAGIFGAAAAAGKLLKLSEQQMTWALGIAATQAAGLREMFGTMCKPLHVGKAAQNGLSAALLAAKNFTSSDQSLEAPFGFTQVLAEDSRLEAITTGLGITFEISENTYKPYACGIVVHPSIDACRQLRNRYALDAKTIRRVVLKVHPRVLELTGKRKPTSGLEAKFSVYHAAAVAVLFDAAAPQHFTDAMARDVNVIVLRDRVIAEIEQDLAEDQAKATIELMDGRQFSTSVEHASGSRHNPLTDAELSDKFKLLTRENISHTQSEKLLALCKSIETLNDVAAIPQMAFPHY